MTPHFACEKLTGLRSTIRDAVVRSDSVGCSVGNVVPDLLGLRQCRKRLVDAVKGLGNRIGHFELGWQARQRQLLLQFLTQPFRTLGRLGHLCKALLEQALHQPASVPSVVIVDSLPLRHHRLTQLAFGFGELGLRLPEHLFERDQTGRREAGGLPTADVLHLRQCGRLRRQ